MRRQDAVQWTESTIESELAQMDHALDGVRVDSAGRGESRERHAEVEAGTMLWQRGRGKIDRDLAMGQPAG